MLKANINKTTKKDSSKGRLASVMDPKCGRRVWGRALLWGALGLAVSVWGYDRSRSFLFSSSYFQINHVEIGGVGAEIQTKLLATLDLQKEPRNLLNLNLDYLHSELMEVPEVDMVSLKRQLPDTLLIEASARYPVAVLVGEINTVLDSQMVAIETLEGNAFLASDLPLITATSAPKITLGQPVEDRGLARAWKTFYVLRKQAPKIAAQISETHYDEFNNITLTFQGGAEVRLGRRALSNALPLLETVWEELEGFQKLEYAELRFKNQVAYKEKGKDTANRNQGSERWAQTQVSKKEKSKDNWVLDSDRL